MDEWGSIVSREEGSSTEGVRRTGRLRERESECDKVRQKKCVKTSSAGCEPVFVLYSCLFVACLDQATVSERQNLPDTSSSSLASKSKVSVQSSSSIPSAISPIHHHPPLVPAELWAQVSFLSAQLV